VRNGSKYGTYGLPEGAMVVVAAVVDILLMLLLLIEVG
jgi:hypothetical protein